MKRRAISLLLAICLSLHGTAWAQSSRTDGIGDQEIARAQQEMAIIRHDLERLQVALTETEYALRERQSQGRIANLLSLGTATVGLSLAALTVANVTTSNKVSGTLVTVQAALSAAASYLNYRETKELPSEAAEKAVSKARQEILAARTSGSDNAESMELLLKLDTSLATLQSALKSYHTHRSVDRSIQLAGVISQSAGTAMTLGFALGLMRGSSPLSQILMASGNIATVIHGITPTNTARVLSEIAETRAAVYAALASL